MINPLDRSDEAVISRYPPGIIVQIVGTEVGTNGRSCEEHTVCGSVLKEDMVVRLWRVQILVEDHEKTAIACIWVTDGINCCRVVFLICHMVAHAMRYDGAPAQVMQSVQQECRGM